MTAKYHDNHNHTAMFSPDASQSLDALCADAIKNGLAGLTLTDHYDKDIISGELHPEVSLFGEEGAEGEWVFDFAKYEKTIQEKQLELFRSGQSLKLLRGVELGYIPYQTEGIWPFMAKQQFDSIILSVHCIGDKDIYFHRDIYEQGHKPVYEAYLELIVQMLESELDFDIVGHYDYVTRYLPGDYQLLRYREFSDHFDTIFRLIRDQGKALEFNTRTRYRMLDRDGIQVGLPDADVYKRFAELGGEFVALSSDSHETANSGRFFDEAAAFLRSNGVNYATHFEARRPITTKIEL